MNYHVQIVDDKSLYRVTMKKNWEEQCGLVQSFAFQQSLRNVWKWEESLLFICWLRESMW